MRPSRPRSGLRRLGTAFAALMVLGGAAVVAADLLALDPSALAAAVERQVRGTPNGSGGGAGEPTAEPPKDRTADPTARPTARPTVRPTDTGPPRDAGADGGVTLVQDPLTDQGEWFESEIREERAQCVFAGALRASRISPGDFPCAGPEQDMPRDSSVAVTTALQTPGSCSTIWFRWDGTAGYRLLVCTNQVRLEVDRPELKRGLLTMNLRRPITVGQAVDVLVEARGPTVQISVDGSVLGRTALPENDLAEGQVLLGISVGASTARPPFTVAFADVEIRSLPR